MRFPRFRPLLLALSLTVAGDMVIQSAPAEAQAVEGVRPGATANFHATLELSSDTSGRFTTSVCVTEQPSLECRLALDFEISERRIPWTSWTYWGVDGDLTGHIGDISIDAPVTGQVSQGHYDLEFSTGSHDGRLEIEAKNRYVVLGNAVVTQTSALRLGDPEICVCALRPAERAPLHTLRNASG